MQECPKGRCMPATLQMHSRPHPFAHGAPSWESREQWRSRPESRVVMRQQWSDLLFLHWRVDVEQIARCLPAGLHVDAWEGGAWVGVVPFAMRKVRPARLPAVPWLSDFLELNLRTYVFDEHGRAGVWFFSLDCNQPVAVGVARMLFGLPYQFASMRMTRADDKLEFASQRWRDPQRQDFRWREAGDAFCAEPGSLEWFLAERYLLFTQQHGQLKWGRVWHEPYVLREARVDSWSDRLFGLNGLSLPARAPDHVLASRGVTVEVHGLNT